MLQGTGLTPRDDKVTDAAGESGDKLKELEAAITGLLGLLESRHARGALAAQDPVLTLARDHIDQAITAGAGPEHRLRLDRLLGHVSETPASRTPRLNGVVLSGPPVITRTADPRSSADLRGRARGLAARSLQSGRENRRFKRYVAPSLWVTVEQASYRTVDWSIGGLALIGGHLHLAPGSEVKVTLAVAGLVDPRHTAAFLDRAVVVRCDAEATRLMLRFVSTASATLKVLEHLRQHRVTPTETAIERPRFG